MCPGPLDGGVEEEEEECIADGNELTTKDEYSMDENFAADFETDNLTCEDMEYFCGKGQHFCLFCFHSYDQARVYIFIIVLNEFGTFYFLVNASECLLLLFDGRNLTSSTFML